MSTTRNTVGGIPGIQRLDSVWQGVGVRWWGMGQEKLHERYSVIAKLKRLKRCLFPDGVREAQGKFGEWEIIHSEGQEVGGG